VLKNGGVTASVMRHNGMIAPPNAMAVVGVRLIGVGSRNAFIKITGAQPAATSTRLP
jgi:hypothetical protein